jgi:hypothetical protein
MAWCSIKEQGQFYIYLTLLYVCMYVYTLFTNEVYMDTRHIYCEVQEHVLKFELFIRTT